MRRRGVGQSHSGRTRERNDDVVFVDDELGLYVVGDGMGVHEKSEMAAQEAVRAAVAEVRARLAEGAASSKGSEELDREDLVALARRASLAACHDVYLLASSDEDRSGMVASMTLVLVRGEFAAVAHVGDARAYLLRDRGAMQLTVDHTLASSLQQTDDDEGAGPAGYGPPLTRALGIRPVVTVDAFGIDLAVGDRILLCSDGLTRHIPSDEWLASQLEGDALDALAEDLISYANEAGGQDNISVVLVALEPSATDAPPASQRVRQLSGRLHALGRVFLFRQLPIGLLSRIITHCQIRRVAADETLFEEGERCDRLFVVAEGRLQLVEKGVVAGELVAGAHIGATTLLHPRPARASLVSSEPSTVIALDSERFWWLVKARPWLGVNLLERLVEELGRELESSIARRDDGIAATSVLAPYERL